MGTMSSHPSPPQRSSPRPSLPVRPPSQPLRQALLSPPASFPLTPSVSPQPSPTRTTVSSQSAPASQASSAFSSPASSNRPSPLLTVAAAAADQPTCTRISCGGQPRYQHCWECLQCELTNQLLLCAFCVAHCHAGHSIALKGLGWHAGVCDCGSGKQKHRCRALPADQLPLPLQRAPSAPAQRRLSPSLQQQRASAAPSMPGPPRMESAQTVPTRPSAGFPAWSSAFSMPPSLPLLDGRQSPGGAGLQLEAFSSVSARDEFKQPQQPRRSSLSPVSAVAIPSPSFAGRASSQPALLPPLPLQRQRPARSVPELDGELGGLEPPEPVRGRSLVRLGDQTHEVQHAAPPPALAQQKPQAARLSSDEGQTTAVAAIGEEQSGEGGERGEGCTEEGQTRDGEQEGEEDEKQAEAGECESGQEGEESGTVSTRDEATEQQVEGRPHRLSREQEGETSAACVVLMHSPVLSDEAPLVSRSFSTPQPHLSGPRPRRSSAAASAVPAPRLPVAPPSSARAGAMPRAALATSSSFSSLVAGPPALDRATSLPAQPSNLDLSAVIRQHYPGLYAKLRPEDWQPLSAHRLTEAAGEAPLVQPSLQCRECRQQEATVCVQPCGHRCLCSDCMWAFRIGKRCPVCRYRIGNLQSQQAAQQP